MRSHQLPLQLQPHQRGLLGNPVCTEQKQTTTRRVRRRKTPTAEQTMSCQQPEPNGRSKPAMRPVEPAALPGLGPVPSHTTHSLAQWVSSVEPNHSEENTADSVCR